MKETPARSVLLEIAQEATGHGDSMNVSTRSATACWKAWCKTRGVRSAATGVMRPVQEMA